MHVSIGNPVVGALVIGTGETLGVHASGVLPAGFSPQTRDATSAGTGPPSDQGAEARRQAGQSSGLRGFRRWWRLLRSLLAALAGAGP